MRTQYGDLPITIDPVTGRATLAQGGTAKPPTRHPHPVRRPTTTPAVPDVAGYDSKLEAERGRYLYALQLSGDLVCVLHHRLSVQLAKDLRYTPDFFFQTKDGSIIVEELKGSMKAKNARDSQTRLKMAAAIFPMFTWQLTTRSRGRWIEQPI